MENYAARNAKAGGEGIDVLVVEDSMTQCVFLTGILEHHGFKTAFASNGIDAIDYLKDNHTRLVISDINMPGMNGYDMCQRIKADPAIDGLTGLQNRRSLERQLNVEIDQAERDNSPLSLILVDVDHFKSFNDTFGHPAGDETLKSFASILAGSIRRSDIAARYGGEEFAVLLPETNPLQAAALAERIRRAAEANPWSRRPVTASFGVATLNGRYDAEKLIANADDALYRAKRSGRNRVAVHGEPGKVHPEAELAAC